MGAGEEAGAGCRVSGRCFSIRVSQSGGLTTADAFTTIELLVDRFHGQLYVELLRLHAGETSSCHSRYHQTNSKDFSTHQGAVSESTNSLEQHKGSTGKSNKG